MNNDLSLSNPNGPGAQAFPDWVGWTAPDTLERFEDLGLQEDGRASRWRDFHLESEGKALQVISNGWLAAGGRLNLKYARIRGKVMDIATIMVYPVGSPALLPVFAAEWVIVGGRAHALILDVEVCSKRENQALSQELVASYADLKRKYGPEFPANREAPEWFQEICMPHAIYCSASLDKLPLLRQAFGEYLDHTLEHFYRPRLSRARAGTEAPSVLEYKHHHNVHSPGRKVLAPKLGSADTEEFLSRWHFGPALA